MLMNKYQWLNKVKCAQIIDKQEKILELCKDYVVLDVGCVGQDIDYNSENWQHNRIRKVAKKLYGVDVLQHEIAKLKHLGYDIHHVNELAPLGISFDVIIISDVIEHVNNITEFIQFYLRYLKANGFMIITTPNPFYFVQFVRIFFFNNVGVNNQHTLWLDPNTFLEISHRLQLKIKDFFWCFEYYDISQLPLKQRLLHLMARILYKRRSFYSPNFMFIIEKSGKN